MFYSKVEHGTIFRRMRGCLVRELGIHDIQPDITEAILQVERFSSSCSNCGGNASMKETHHEMLTMAGYGCGAKFVGYVVGYRFTSGEIPAVGLQLDIPCVSSRVASIHHGVCLEARSMYAEQLSQYSVTI